jgi:hypothetical protein
MRVRERIGEWEVPAWTTAANAHVPTSRGPEFAPVAHSHSPTLQRKTHVEYRTVTACVSPSPSLHFGPATLRPCGLDARRSHRIEIWFAVHGGKLYLMSGGRDRADWVRNLRTKYTGQRGARR